MLWAPRNSHLGGLKRGRGVCACVCVCVCVCVDAKNHRFLATANPAGAPWPSLPLLVEPPAPMGFPVYCTPEAGLDLAPSSGPGSRGDGRSPFSASGPQALGSQAALGLSIQPPGQLQATLAPNPQQQRKALGPELWGHNGLSARPQPGRL